VRLDGLAGDAELASDLVVRAALDDEADDLTLTLRQRPPTPGGGLALGGRD
jgi:hypothetical protein